MKIFPAARKTALGHSVVPAFPAVRTGRQTMSGPRLLQGVVLALLGLLVGLLLAANWQSKPKQPVGADEYPRQIGADTIQRLEAEQADLKRQIGELRKTIADRQGQAAAAKSTLADINRLLADQKMAAGMEPLKGPGLRVILDDTASKTIPSGDDPSLYIVHEYQLRDLANLLWTGGAEAIAINGERLVSTTSIYCVGSTILVNNTRLSAPYEFSIIGDGQAMEDTLNNPGNLKSLKTRIKVYGLQFKTSRQREVLVPAYSGGLVIKQATITGP